MEFTQVILSESIQDVGSTNSRMHVGTLEVEGVYYPIYNCENIIGRDDSSNIVIKNNVISSKHAVIEADDPNAHVIYDVGSTNKTKLGMMTLKPHARYVIKNGDQLTFGNICATYNISSKNPRTPQKENTFIVPETPEKEEAGQQEEDTIIKVIMESPTAFEHDEDSQLEKSDTDMFDENKCVVPVSLSDNRTNDVAVDNKNEIYEMDTYNFEDEEFLNHLKEQGKLDLANNTGIKNEDSIFSHDSQNESIYDLQTQAFHEKTAELEINGLCLDTIAKTSHVDLHISSSDNEDNEIVGCGSQARMQNSPDKNNERNSEKLPNVKTSIDTGSECSKTEIYLGKNNLAKRGADSLFLIDPQPVGDLQDKSIVEPWLSSSSATEDIRTSASPTDTETYKGKDTKNSEIIQQSLAGDLFMPASQNMDIFDDTGNEKPKVFVSANDLDNFTESGDESMCELATQNYAESIILLKGSKDTDPTDKPNISTLIPLSQAFDETTIRPSVGSLSVKEVEETLSTTIFEDTVQPDIVDSHKDTVIFSHNSISLNTSNDNEISFANPNVPIELPSINVPSDLYEAATQPVSETSIGKVFKNTGNIEEAKASGKHIFDIPSMKLGGTSTVSSEIKDSEQKQLDVTFSQGFYEAETQPFFDAVKNSNIFKIPVSVDDTNSRGSSLEVIDKKSHGQKPEIPEQGNKMNNEMDDLYSLPTQMILNKELANKTFTQGFYEAATQPCDEEIGEIDFGQTECHKNKETNNYREKTVAENSKKLVPHVIGGLDESLSYFEAETQPVSPRKPLQTESGVDGHPCSDRPVVGSLTSVSKAGIELSNLTLTQGFYEADTQPVIDNTCKPSKDRTDDVGHSNSCGPTVGSLTSGIVSGIDVSNLTLTEGFFEADTQPVSGNTGKVSKNGTDTDGHSNSDGENVGSVAGINESVMEDSNLMLGQGFYEADTQHVPGNTNICNFSKSDHITVSKESSTNKSNSIKENTKLHSWNENADLSISQVDTQPVSVDNLNCEKNDFPHQADLQLGAKELNESLTFFEAETQPSDSNIHVGKAEKCSKESMQKKNDANTNDNSAELITHMPEVCQPEMIGTKSRNIYELDKEPLLSEVDGNVSNETIGAETLHEKNPIICTDEGNDLGLEVGLHSVTEKENHEKMIAPPSSSSVTVSSKVRNEISQSISNSSQVTLAVRTVNCQEVTMDFSESLNMGEDSIPAKPQSEAVTNTEDRTLRDTVDMSISCLNLYEVLTQNAPIEGASDGKLSKSKIIPCKNSNNDDVEELLNILMDDEVVKTDDSKQSQQKSTKKSSAAGVNQKEKGILKSIKESINLFQDTQSNKNMPLNDVSENSLYKKEISDLKSCEEGSLTLTDLSAKCNTFDLIVNSEESSQELNIKFKTKRFNIFPSDTEDSIENIADKNESATKIVMPQKEVRKSNQKNSTCSTDIVGKEQNTETEQSTEELDFKFPKKGCNAFPPDSEDLMDSQPADSENWKTPRKSQRCNKGKNSQLMKQQMFDTNQSPVKTNTKGCNVFSKKDHAVGDEKRKKSSPEAPGSGDSSAFVSRGNITFHSQETLEELEEQFNLIAGSITPAQSMSEASDSEGENELNEGEDEPGSPVVRRSERKRSAKNLYKPLLSPNKDVASESMVTRKKKDQNEGNACKKPNDQQPDKSTLINKSTNACKKPNDQQPDKSTLINKSTNACKKPNDQQPDKSTLINKSTNACKKPNDQQPDKSTLINKSTSVKKFIKASPQKEQNPSPKNDIKVIDQDCHTEVIEPKKRNSSELFDDSQSSRGSLDNSESVNEFGRGKRKRVKISFEGFVVGEDLKKSFKRLSQSPSAAVSSESTEQTPEGGKESSVNKKKTLGISLPQESFPITQSVSIILHDCNKPTAAARVNSPGSSRPASQITDDINDDDLLLPPPKTKIVSLKSNKSKTVKKVDEKKNQDLLNKSQNFSFCDKLDELFNIWGPADRVKLSPRAPRQTSKVLENYIHAVSGGIKTSQVNCSKPGSSKSSVEDKDTENGGKSSNHKSEAKSDPKNNTNSRVTKEKNDGTGDDRKLSHKHKVNEAPSDVSVAKRLRRSTNSTKSDSFSTETKPERTGISSRKLSDDLPKISKSDSNHNYSENNLTGTSAPKKKKSSNEQSLERKESTVLEDVSDGVLSKTTQENRNIRRNKNSKSNKKVNAVKPSSSPSAGDLDNYIMSQEFSFHQKSTPKKISVNDGFKEPQVVIRRSSRSKVSENKVEQKRSEKVMFTGLSDRKLSTLVTNLGGEVVESPFTCTVLVTDKVKRTTKFLSALSRGLPIVTPEWLQESSRAGKFSDFDKFIVTDGEAEKQYSFNLKSSLQKATSKKLLDGWIIFVTPSVNPPPKEIKSIVECSGGKFLAKEPSRWTVNSFVISCEADKTKWSSLSRRGKLPVIVGTEALFSGILQQNLELQRHRLI